MLGVGGPGRSGQVVQVQGTRAAFFVEDAVFTWKEGLTNFDYSDFGVWQNIFL